MNWHKHPRTWVVVAGVVLVAYALGPIVAGVWEIGDRRGPRIYPIRFHEILYLLAWEYSEHAENKPRVAHNAGPRPWFYGLDVGQVDEPGQGERGKASTAVENSLHAFVNRPSQENWDSLVNEALASASLSDAQMVILTIRYNEARLRRDLPNSMALVGITPNEKVRASAAEATQALEGIRPHVQSDTMWKFLEALVRQTFDEQLTYSACEMACRLSPERYDEMAERVTRDLPGRPELQRVIRATRDRWESGEQHGQPKG